MQPEQALAQALKSLELAQERAGDAEAVGRATLPASNKWFKPGAWDAASMLEPVASRLSQGTATTADCGPAPRWGPGLVAAHAKNCAACSVGGDAGCVTLRTLQRWVSEGVNLRELLKKPEGTLQHRPRNSVIQEELLESQQRHLQICWRLAWHRSARQRRPRSCLMCSSWVSASCTKDTQAWPSS